MLKNIWAAIDGYKSYLLIGLLMVIQLFSGGSADGLDLTRLVNDPDLLQTELVLALVAAFRSAIAKIGG